MAPGGMMNVPSARNFTTVDWSERIVVVTLEPVVVTDAGTTAAEAGRAKQARALVAATAKRAHPRWSMAVFIFDFSGGALSRSGENAR